MAHLGLTWRLCVRLMLFGVCALAALPARAQDDAQMELGRQVFVERAQPPCAICHTLADAGATGTIAPSLDELKPTTERVRTALMDGPGVMPVYDGALTEEEMAAVATYVAAVAGSD